tara:strand:+ start:1043 stop:1567 length:525 start_codon:yes stop_codon:yes gene_type:complete
MAYFSYFPVTAYNLSNENNRERYNLVTNILIRIRKKLEITNVATFEQHYVNDGDRADTLAHQYYNDSSLHWLIMYANYITNPYYDWPMTYFDLQKYAAKKYGSDINAIHHYEDSNGYEVDAPGTLIGPSTTAGSATPISNFLYEERLNDSKRIIDIIKARFVKQIVKEFKQILS